MGSFEDVVSQCSLVILALSGNFGGIFIPYILNHRTSVFSLSTCHLLILHYQRNAARLQQLFQAFRERQHREKVLFHFDRRAGKMENLIETGQSFRETGRDDRCLVRLSIHVVMAADIDQQDFII
jgi:hypothetical protein